uniref:Uncharacterized protein n=1 Tax=Hordeum vulgare subsp. vulgare TaxID=112509 RepID=A0A8I6Y0W5_HORVV
MYVVKRDGWAEMVHFDKITARLKKLRRSAPGYTWASPPASSTSSPPRPPPRPPPRSGPPSRTMPPSRRGLLCPTCRQVASRQVEIVCVVLVNSEHSGRKVQERIGKLLSFSLVSEK